jgi:NTP pyrophosphatase (non-canonical NTP hydrolase)
MENYGTFCLSTESVNMQAIRDRLNDPNVQRLLYYLLMDHIDTMKQLDVLKKYVFYGKKGAELVAAPNGLPYNQAAFDRDNVIRRLHCVLGIVTEGVELSEHMLNELFLGDNVSQETWLKELGDPCWYIAVAADTIGLSFEEVLEANVQKLSARYKKADGSVGFTEDKAQKHKGD